MTEVVAELHLVDTTAMRIERDARTVAQMEHEQGIGPQDAA
jgi:hypothetical protein